jgi:hypothetical protein
MTSRLGVLLIGVLLIAAQADAQDQVRIQVAPMGALRFTLPDGATADWVPSVMGAEWAYTNWRDGFMVEGSGQDLFTVGQRTRLPVRNADNKVVDLFAQFSGVEGVPEALHFTYRFTAPETMRLNTAYVECTLPEKPFAGAALETIGGLTCPPTLPAEPVEQQSHLANGTASGLAAADGTSHAVRVQLDQPRWCVALDARVWKVPWFALQFCALAAEKGTTLAKDAAAEVNGNMVFACPVRIAEPEAPPPAASLVGEALYWSATDPQCLWLMNAAGERVAWFDPIISAPAGQPPQLKEQVLTGADGEGSRLEAGWATARDVKLALKQTALVTDRTLTIEAELAAPEGYDSPPIVRYCALPTRHFAGCKVTFLREGEPSFTLSPNTLDRVLGRAIAHGVRISQGDVAVLQLGTDAERCWTIYAFDEAFGVAECLLGNPIARHTYGGSGDHYEGKLMATAGDR